ncbi:MAG TPA: 2-phospho-L-lactate transferase CofD family protein [bacterium]|nr:2-phospho-L-lactate transferase CofD family protein [bacterium]HPN30093.1 2-phospho-L-lactate transferase CofD family protein [bacterium]
MNNQNFNVVIFSGGRGTQSITDAILKYPLINITMIVNTYDDGLSTGRIRKFIGNMLGPSDIRKNISRLMPIKETSDRSLNYLLEHRLPVSAVYEDGINTLELFISDKPCGYDLIDRHFNNLTVKQTRFLKKYCFEFFKLCEARKKNNIVFDFSDCSLGNIFFAGCYLCCGQDFNKAVEEFQKFCSIQGKVLNVTNGQNLILTGLKQDNTFLKNEAEIVSPQNSSHISEIFLLKDYFNNQYCDVINSKSFAEKLDYLRNCEKPAELNTEVEKSLKEADIIIYGPGTQNSSLFPTYLTENLAECIAENNNAEKIFVANIYRDYDIQSESINSLIDKFYFYISRKNKIKIEKKDIVSQYFFQKSDNDQLDNPNYISFSEHNFTDLVSKVKIGDWEDKSGKHLGGKILDEILKIIQSKRDIKLKPFHHTLSIIVPALNEAKTIKTVLNKLSLLNFDEFNLNKEIIVVDGGSTDKTLEFAKSESHIKVLSLASKKGRGAALKFGIEHAKGNIIVFFPSDNEYKTDEIHSIILPIIQGQFDIVFGTRLIKCANLDASILNIYKKNYFNYFLSKYGGIALSVMSLVLYNKYITDPLTSFKAFNADILKKFNLKKDGVDMDMEIIAKSSKMKKFILEIPVEFSPRLKSEGKKITLLDGLKSIITFLTLKFSKEKYDF